MNRYLTTVAALLLAALPSNGHAASPTPDPRWDTWQLLLWQDRTQVQMDGLGALGFTGAKLRGTGGQIDPAERAKRQHAGLPPYIENTATDFYAPYHRYVANQAINAQFVAAQALHRQDPAGRAAFIREPGLSDPVWLQRIAARMKSVVQTEAPDHPLFYNLGDESGIGDLAANWDFDLAPASLAGFRIWLHGQYPDLAALNQEWGTEFTTWDEVQPMLTGDAVTRTDGNFAAWSDFKAWMDVAFARAVRAGTDALHAADPAARSALEGGQIPGWGGYDYALLAPAVDVMEIYDAGEALDLALAFNPALIPLRTSFGSGPRETFDAWRNLLHGGRGEVVWDEADDVVGQDGMPGPRGLELAALGRAIRPVAALLHQSRPVMDPVAVLYSQASFRMQWILDRQAGDHDWSARDAEREYDDNPWRAARRVLTQRLAGLGVQPRIVTGAMIGAGALHDIKVLLLPHAIALSDAEISAIKAFRAAGGTVFADTEPGLYDGHGRRRATPPLPEVMHPQAIRSEGGVPGPGDLEALDALLHAAGVLSRARFIGPDGQRASGIEAHWFSNPGGLVLTLQAAAPWAAPPRVVIRLPARLAVSDQRKATPVVPTDRIEVMLDPIEPTVLLLAPLP